LCYRFKEAGEIPAQPRYGKDDEMPTSPLGTLPGRRAWRKIPSPDTCLEPRRYFSRGLESAFSVLKAGLQGLLFALQEKLFYGGGRI